MMKDTECLYVNDNWMETYASTLTEEQKTQIMPGLDKCSEVNTINGYNQGYNQGNKKGFGNGILATCVVISLATVIGAGVYSLLQNKQKKD